MGGHHGACEPVVGGNKFCPRIEHGYGLVRSQFFLVKCAGHLVLDFLAAGGKVLMSNPLCGPAVQTEA